MKLPLYFDNHATTALDPRALDAMMPFLTGQFGNAESVQHPYGWQAKTAVEKARGQVAALLSAEHPNEIVFTSGATESIHLAILGLLSARNSASHVITANAEHKATLEVCARAEKLGHTVTVLPVDSFGRVSLEQVKAAVRPTTALISLMHGNNEIGTLHPIVEIGQWAKERGLAFHVDAAQTAGKQLIDVRAMGIDLLSISGHKLYGPKGIGVLYVRRGVSLTSHMVGGGQERGLRGGTPNVPGIVGLGVACELGRAEMETESERLRMWRDRIIREVQGALEGVLLNGHPTERLCNNVSFSILGVQADQLMLGLNDIAYSSASACSAGGTSHVLNAIGRDASDPFLTTARFGLGRFTTEDQVTTLIERLIVTVRNARDISKGYTGLSKAVPKI